MPIVLAAFAAIVYGTGDWFGGRASRIQRSAVVALLGQLVSAALAGLLVLASGDAFPGSSTIRWALAGGVAGGLGVAGLYHALSRGDVAVVAPVTAVTGAALPVIVGVTTGERPSVVGIVGIAVALLAVAVVSGALGTHHHSTTASIVALSVLVGACFGLLFVALDRTDPESGMWPLFVVRWTSVPCLVLLVLAGRQGVVRDRPSVLLGVVAGVFDQLANLLYLEAVRRGLISIVVVVTSLYPAATVLLAFAVDRERIGRWQMAGLGLAAVALVLVSLGRG